MNAYQFRCIIWILEIHLVTLERKHDGIVILIKIASKKCQTTINRDKLRLRDRSSKVECISSYVNAKGIEILGQWFGVKRKDVSEWQKMCYHAHACEWCKVSEAPDWFVHRSGRSNVYKKEWITSGGHEAKCQNSVLINVILEDRNCVTPCK